MDSFLMVGESAIYQVKWEDKLRGAGGTRAVCLSRGGIGKDLN